MDGAEEAFRTNPVDGELQHIVQHYAPKHRQRQRHGLLAARGQP